MVFLVPEVTSELTDRNSVCFELTNELLVRASELINMSSCQCVWERKSM